MTRLIFIRYRKIYKKIIFKNMNAKQYITSTFALVICRNSEGKWLCVKECHGQGWWIAGGFVEPGESLFEGAKRETLEEAGIEIEIKGVLRMEHSAKKNYARLRVIFYAEPKDNKQIPKSIPDEESECAAFFSLEEILKLRSESPGWRGEELYVWPQYLENKGLIAPLNFLTAEVDPIKYYSLDYNINAKNNLLFFSICEKEKNNKLNIPNPPTSSSNQELFINLLYSQPLDLKKIKEMLIGGFNPNLLVNEKKWSPLHYAIKMKNLELINLLLIYGADISHATHRNRNCINFAVQESLIIANSLLLKLNELPEDKRICIINGQDIDDEDTSLHTSAIIAQSGSSEHFEIYKSLVFLGADENIKNKKGLTPKQIIKNIN